MNVENEEFSEENIQEKENIQEQPQENTDANQEIKQEKTLEDEYAELKDRNIRLFAEFENYKKRTTKERLELFKSANQSLLVDLLPVLDDFDRAINEIKKDNNSDALKGVELIQNKFVNILNSKGLTKMETKAGDDFDTEKHEAITQIAAPSDDMVGKVVDVVETGYTLNDKVIRYAKVVVGK